MKKAVLLFVGLVCVVLYFGVPHHGESQSLGKPRVFSEIKPQVIRAEAFGISPEVSTLLPAAPDYKNRSGKLGKAELSTREIKNKIPLSETS